MNFNYYWSLYWRNVWGVIRNGFSIGCELRYFAIPFWLCALALWPITLTLGAGIKTFFDGWTRKYTLNKEVVDAIPDSVNNMTEDQVSELCEQAAKQEKERACFSQSLSSAWLMKRLSEYNMEQEKEEAAVIKNKHEELALKQLNPTVSIDMLDKFKPIYNGGVLSSLELEGQYQSELENFKVDHMQLPCSGRLKADIARYMGEEKNNGKKLFQLIVAFFNRSMLAKPNIDGALETDRLTINSTVNSTI